MNTYEAEARPGSPTPKGAPLFTKDFSLVVLGQIISLFGNAVLRFALPLYIFDQSGSAAVFGFVSASAFLPMIVFSPIGGIFADRVNKQRIMVVLDFFTCALILGFIVANGKLALVPLVVVVLMMLYGIQGAYAPAVQASIPLLAQGGNLISANAVVNLVQSFAGLVGPVVGGMLYGTYGLSPILYVSCACFFASAVMELFIVIPHKKQEAKGGVWAIVREDMSISLRYIIKDNPVMFRVILLVFSFNLFLSSMIMIGLPVIVTRYLGMSSQLYGFTQGALAAGGLAGGLAAGVIGKKLHMQQSWLLLLIPSVCILPMGAALMVALPAFAQYLLVSIISFLMMIFATMFTIQMLAFVQAVTPGDIVGKVISCLMALCVCAQPIGQAMYGVLFQRFEATPWLVLFGTALVSMGVSIFSKRTFRTMDSLG